MGDARVIHFEIVGKDGPALQRYYSDLFGWAINNDFPGGYGMTDAAVTGPIVGIGTSPDGGAGHVTGYVTVPDINGKSMFTEDISFTVSGMDETDPMVDPNIESQHVMPAECAM